MYLNVLGHITWLHRALAVTKFLNLCRSCTLQNNPVGYCRFLAVCAHCMKTCCACSHGLFGMGSSSRCYLGLCTQDWSMSPCGLCGMWCLSVTLVGMWLVRLSVRNRHSLSFAMHVFMKACEYCLTSKHYACGPLAVFQGRLCEIIHILQMG